MSARLLATLLRALPQILKLIDAHNPIRKNGANFQLPAHTLDNPLQRAEIHIGAALHLRYRRLMDSKNPRELLLGELPRLAKFSKRHLFDHLLSRGRIAPATLRRHLGLKFLKVL